MKTKSDLRVSLRDLPDEGRDYDFTRETGELNLAIDDLIGKNPYRFHVNVKPAGNAYHATGRLETALNVQCARCADEFKFPVELSINEFLLVEKALGKNDHVGKVNHAHEFAEGGPDYMTLESEVFDLGEYAHEAIALAEPMRPLCRPNDPEGCAHPERLERPWLSIDGTGEAARATNPFAALQNLKLKS